MTAPSSSGGAGGLVLTGVTMELTGTRGPATVVAGVALAVGAEGLTVTAPSGPPTFVPWPSVGWARCGESGLLDDGAPAVAVSASVAGHLVRWLVPREQMPPVRAVAVDHLLSTRVPGPVAGAATSPAPAPAREAPPAPASAPAPARAGHSPALPPLPARAGRAAARRRARADRSLAVTVAWLAVLTLVLVGAALLMASSIHVPPGPGGTRTRGSHRSAAVTAARTVARAVALRRADLPAGWTAAPTASGPLSGLLNASGASSGAATTAPGATTARYSRCLGVGTASVPFVSAGPVPLASSSSGTFAGPATGAAMQVASITTVYATAGPVRRAVVQLQRPGFAACFGSAVGAELARSAASQAPSGVTAGKASIRAVPLPRWAGIRATGLVLELPLDVRGEATSVQLGFVFVTGLRVESTLVSFSTTGFPQSVTRALAATLEEEVAASAAR